MELERMMTEVNNLKSSNELLKEKFELLLHQHERILILIDEVIDLRMEKIKIPHRCPVCNGTTFDEEGALCHPCDGKGVVWG